MERMHDMVLVLNSKGRYKIRAVSMTETIAPVLTSNLSEPSKNQHFLLTECGWTAAKLMIIYTQRHQLVI